MKNTDDKALKLEELSNTLLSLMGTGASAKVAFDKDNDAFQVEIDAKSETGLLIGRRGETINSLQTVLGMMFKETLGEWARVVINVGDYREKQGEYLKGLALEAADRAKTTGEDQFLYNLSAQERRIIHMELAGSTDVITESTGEEPERYLVIKLKK